MSYRTYCLFPILSLILLLLLCYHSCSVLALDPGEIVALKDMQAEWGTQLGWTGDPQCSWQGIGCNSVGHVTRMYVLYFWYCVIVIPIN